MENIAMINDSVVVLSGSLKIHGQQHQYSTGEQRLCDDYSNVQFLVYKTSNKHFAVVYPLDDLVCANRPICCLNLKTCTVNVYPGVKYHDIEINTNNDFDYMQLVLRIEAKSYNLQHLSAELKSEVPETARPFGPVLKKKSLSRQTSLQSVEEDLEIA